MPSDADAIIESSGLTIRKVTLHDKPALAAKQGSVTGTVNLVAKAVAKRASYNWQSVTKTGVGDWTQVVTLIVK